MAGSRRAWLAAAAVLLVLASAVRADCGCSSMNSGLVAREKDGEGAFVSADFAVDEEDVFEPEAAYEEEIPDDPEEMLRKRMEDKPSSVYVEPSSLLPPLVDLAGGSFKMGTDAPMIPGDGEGPARAVTVKPFRIMAHEVTNEAYNAYLGASGHVPTADLFGWSFVFQPHASAMVDAAVRSLGW